MYMNRKSTKVELSVRARAVCGLFLLCICCCDFSFCQSERMASSSPRFDVASVKLVPSEQTRSSGTDFTMKGSKDGVKLTIRNATLKACLQRAYGLKEYQISGPGWISSEHYDITATTPPVKMPVLWQMLQTLLVERLKLSMHRTTKELPVYELVVSKEGLKIRPSEPNGPSGIGGDVGKLVAKKTSMAQFAAFLSREVNRPVLDATGIAGVFDFTLDFQEGSPQNSSVSDKKESDQMSAADAPAPVGLAIKQQLGLELKAKKAPVEVLVIDDGEKVPTPD